MSMHLFKEQLG